MKDYRDAAVMPCEHNAQGSGVESIFSLIGKSEESAIRIEETVRVLENNLFGCEGNDAPPDEPRCFRDLCEQHAERMARIDTMLNSVKERLGV